MAGPRKLTSGVSARNTAVGSSIGEKGYIGTGGGTTLYEDFWEYTPEETPTPTPTATPTATPTPTPSAPIVSFVIGDLSAVVDQRVTFWGAQWASSNVLSGGPAPSAFKGYADTIAPDPASCGGTWTTRPGNSNPPSTLPSTIRVIVASSITRSRSVISGNIPQMAIISVDPGYQPDPGHPGTGTVLSVSCQ